METQSNQVLCLLHTVKIASIITQKHRNNKRMALFRPASTHLKPPDLVFQIKFDYQVGSTTIMEISGSEHLTSNKARELFELGKVWIL